MFVNSNTQNHTSALPALDNQLRPKNWSDYIGQEKVKKTLQIMIGASKKRSEALDHILLYGNPGLGKTTLSYIIAKQRDVNIHVTSGPALRKSGDLASILSNLSEGDVLFIDEIHRLNTICEELIYPAMEDFKLDLIVGSGPMAQNMEINLPKFTLIAATTRIANLSSPLRSRFGATFQLNPYAEQELSEIILKSAQILNITITAQAAQLIAQSSRATPRIANHLLKRVRDFAQVNNLDIIEPQTVKEVFDFMEIDSRGLGPEDRKILTTIIKAFDGGPVGLKTLAAATIEDEDCIIDIYEPYLLQLGFLERTARGRKVTNLAYDYLKMKKIGSTLV
ncbi:MAG: Holliday junction branch migration DNA helicase RuvB [Candidatus Paceibacterota bacterium]